MNIRNMVMSSEKKHISLTTLFKLQVDTKTWEYVEKFYPNFTEHSEKVVYKRNFHL